MMGWAVAVVVWALGIYPTHGGLVEQARTEGDYLELAPAEKKVADWLFVVASLLWPVCALYELVVEVLGPKEGENNNDDPQ